MEQVLRNIFFCFVNTLYINELSRNILDINVAIEEYWEEQRLNTGAQKSVTMVVMLNR